MSCWSDANEDNKEVNCDKDGLTNASAALSINNIPHVIDIIYLHFVVGHLITVESTSSHGRDKAVLVSPVLDQQYWSCVRLVYQITGPGSLQLHLRPHGDNFDYKLWTADKASDSWLIASVDLPNTTIPYQVRICGLILITLVSVRQTSFCCIPSESFLHVRYRGIGNVQALKGLKPQNPPGLSFFHNMFRCVSVSGSWSTTRSCCHGNTETTVHPK